MTHPVRFSVEASIAEIVLDRPAVLNALDPPALEALRAALAACRDDERVRAIVVTGSGERAFCVGTDLKATIGTSTGYVRGYRLDAIGLRKPLIAAINGACMGGGLELALQADLRIASSNATFALPEARVGSFPGGGGVPLLLRAVPRAIAMRLLLTGETIDAQRAREHGLVSEVVEPAQLRDAARDLAMRVARCAPLSLAAILDVAARCEGRPLAEGFEASWEAFDALAGTSDRAEGRRAFAEKRPPRFTGK
ncbi:MAG: enoyl-CoA hydratase-related protein [Burkholderiales bacterium]